MDAQRATPEVTQRDAPQVTPQTTPQATQRDTQADRQADRQGEPAPGLSQSTCSTGKPKPPSDARKPDQRDRKSSLTPPDKPRPVRTPTRDKKPAKPEPKTGSPRGPPVGPLQSRQEQHISELPNKSKEAAPGRRGSAGGVPAERRKETAPPPPPPTTAAGEAEEAQPVSPEGADKENSCSRSRAEGLARPSPCGGAVKAAPPSYPDRGEYLQSVHVSTSSTPESSTAGVPGPPREEEEEEQQQQGGGVEDGSCTEAAVEMEVEEQQQQQEEEVVSRSHQGTSSEESEAAAPNGGSPPPPAAAAAPGLTRLGLTGPVLTKHGSSKGKPGSHEPSLHKPNLNIARRVRNVSESRRGDAEKESGLKPTVRQLISSSGSRRNVNWEQVYQEVRKKQGQGKGWPRFGIEMVSYDHGDPPREEDPDMALLEGFQWDSLLDSAHTVAPRKRSLSESSLAPGRPAASLDLFSCHVPGDRPDGEEEEEEEEQGGPPPQTRPPAPEEREEAEHKVFPSPGAEPARGADEGPAVGRPTEAGARRPSEGAKKGRVRVLQRAESEVEIGGLGAELLDAQAMGKKRRAAGDIPSQEIHSLKKNKRMKIKSKKERFLVDQLLAVSQKEEELSLSLQALDTGLFQARATLQAAYMDVQRIMVQKQQVATDMGNLRNQRIELLKGMKGGFEDPASLPQVKQEHGEFDSSIAPPLSTATTMATDVGIPSVHLFPPSQPPPPPASSSPPARPSTPPAPAVVKQEPLSPDQEHKEIQVTLVRSCTPETPATLTKPLPDPGKLQWSPDRGPVADQTHTPPPRGHGSPAHCQDDLPAAGGTILDHVDRESSPLDSKLHLAPLMPHRRTSDPWNHGNASVTSEESGLTPALHLPLPHPNTLPLPQPALPPPFPEMVLKRVRKLRKRRVLNKTQGAEPAGNTSDTEADEDAAKPRRLPPRRRSSAGSMVSTSTPPTAPEDGEPLEEEEEEKERVRVPPTREEEFDSALEMGESCADVVNLESSEPEECMEVTMACQQPPAPGPGLGLGLGLGLELAPDSSRVEFFNLACNVVSSTSDMDTSTAPRPYPSAGQMPPPPNKAMKTKTSSDVSSDPSEEAAPTEGVFEGHQEAVNGLQIHKGLLYTCSGDRTVKAFDLVSHECVAVFEGHSSKVNCVLVSATVGLTHRLYSGSSDQTVRCYSLRTGVLEQQFSLSDRVLCLHSRWKVLYVGLANGTVATFNLKTNRPMEVFECHGPRAVSCLSSAQEGARKVLLVGSYDSTVSVRDARNGLLLRTLGGHTKTVLCMKVVNDLVFSGSSDHSVHAHNIHTGKLVRIYKGHSHAVTMVAVLGKVMLTASLDKLVRVYELQSNDRLQVYGGHKDMVMCMTVHKSMIYTGCYDGSVQAVKLNLLQNFSCMWHGCSLIFAVREHLEQHLADAHTNHCFQTLKCRWRNCDEFFCTRNGSKQGIAAHMQKHVEDLVKSDT